MIEKLTAERLLEVTKTVTKRNSSINLHIHFQWPNEALQVRETLAKIGCLPTLEEFFKKGVEELEKRLLSETQATISEWKNARKEIP